MNNGIKDILNKKYGMVNTNIPWIDYSVIYSSMDELEKSVEEYKCYLCSIKEEKDLLLSVVEISDNNMLCGGLIVMGFPSKEEIDLAFKKSDIRFSQHY
jgi:riboflavin synthase